MFPAHGFSTPAQPRPFPLPPKIVLDHAVTLQAHDYWRICRGDRRMPMREDLSPLAMRGFLPHIALAEIADDAGTARYRIRLAGLRWDDVFGPITGKWLSQFLPPLSERRWRAMLDAVRGRTEPFSTRLTILGDDDSRVAAELLVAPLGKGEVATFFMCLAATQER